MPHEYQTAKHSAEQSDVAQEEQSWCPQNSQTVLLGSIWHTGKSDEILSPPHQIVTKSRAQGNPPKDSININL